MHHYIISNKSRITNLIRLIIHWNETKKYDNNLNISIIDRIIVTIQGLVGQAGILNTKMTRIGVFQGQAQTGQTGILTTDFWMTIIIQYYTIIIHCKGKDSTSNLTTILKLIKNIAHGQLGQNYDFDHKYLYEKENYISMARQGKLYTLTTNLYINSRCSSWSEWDWRRILTTNIWLKNK